MHWILAPEPPVPQVCVPIIDDLLASPEFLAAEHPMTWLRQKLIVNDDQIQQIAALTVGQKDNCLWSAVRRNRLTASNFGCILAAVKRNRYPISLYKRLCQAYDLSKKDAIIWGLCNESVAVDKYRSFGDAVVEPTGIWLHHNGVLGCSPDGMIRRPAAFGFHHQSPALMDIMQTCNIQPEILEVKCPYSAKEKTIAEAVDTIAEFCLEIQEFRGERIYKLKESHPYYDQVQGQLFVTNKHACDFVVWTPKDIAIVRIPQDLVWQRNISVLTDFYFHKFMPHLQQ
uniref:Uncharacterized protein LOC111099145 n=1 Tax=Crassostrea virginica TaxID=6565 RepID=A0A8B8A4Z4_CRAVI|nr:uncharacterized protein LOC111099145 [Crassostrea virginica]